MSESFELSVIIPASPERIYNAWLTSQEHSAITGAEADITSQNGTRLTLIHNNLPDGQSEQYKEGWIEYYFKPFQRYFSDQL